MFFDYILFHFYCVYGFHSTIPIFFCDALPKILSVKLIRLYLYVFYFYIEMDAVCVWKRECKCAATYACFFYEYDVYFMSFFFFFTLKCCFFIYYYCVMCVLQKKSYENSFCAINFCFFLIFK